MFHKQINKCQSISFSVCSILLDHISFDGLANILPARRVEMHFADNGMYIRRRRSSSRRGRRLRYVRSHCAAADRLIESPMTPMTRVASRSFHDTRSCVPVHTNARRANEQHDDPAAAAASLSPRRGATSRAPRANKPFKAILERTARNVVFEEEIDTRITKKSRLDISVAAAARARNRLFSSAFISFI